MERKVCELSIVATQTQDELCVDWHLTFAGDDDDLINIFASLFDAFELDDVEAHIVTVAALKRRREEATQ